MEASPPTKRIRVGAVIDETFSIYGRNFGTLIGIAILIFLVVGILTAILAGPARSDITWGELFLVLLAIVIHVAAEALYTGFVVKLVQDTRGGNARDVTVGTLLSSASHAIPALIVMGILYGLGVGIGLFLFIVPGLILLTIWAVTAPAIVVEGAGALESFGRSRDLVRGDAWPVFWTIVVVFLITAVISGVLGAIGDAISGVGYGAGVTIAAIVTVPIHAIAVSVIFFDLGGGRSAPPAAAPAEPPPAPAA